MIDYISQLPLPVDQIPQGLKDLLSIEDITNPQKEVIVTHRYEKNLFKDNHECAHMTMATVPQEDINNIKVLQESTNGLVSFSTPDCRSKGGARDYSLSISGYKYIVASWGDSSHFSFFLAEDVWMMLGLKPRLIGDTEQKVIFDEVSLPDYGVAQGDVSSEYYFRSNKDVKWTMRNDYLRKYLWMRNYVGVRVFYYEARIQRTTEVINLLSGSKHFKFDLPWIDFEIVDNGDNILLQAWGSVQSVQPELCKKLNIDELIWPGYDTPMTSSRAKDIRNNEYVLVNDSFLTKYEKDSSYDAIPFYDGYSYRVAPSYGGQWSFRDCIRVGRNLVRIPFYELYRGIPEEEVYHVFDYAKDPNQITENDLSGEHIVSKTFKFARELARLSDNLVALGRSIGVTLSNADILEINRTELESEGISNYPVLQKLAFVAPNDMQEPDFLNRCKTINEILNKIKSGSLKKLLIAMGVNKSDIEKFQTLKLLQSLLNLIEPIIEQNEDSSVLKNATEFADFKTQNKKVASFFINNDLRNAEAHEAVNKSIEHLAKLGFDSATLAIGYSNALDFVFDGVINSLSEINTNIEKALE